jgi:hypothetical protein
LINTFQIHARRGNLKFLAQRHSREFLASLHAGGWQKPVMLARRALPAAALWLHLGKLETWHTAF